MNVKKLSLIILVVSIGILSGCTSEFSGSSNSRDDYEPSFNAYNVTLEVTGTADSVDLYYSFAGRTISRDNVRLPWSSSFLGLSGDWFYISAQNTGKYGEIEASVYVDSKRVDWGWTNSAYGIATASELLD